MAFICHISLNKNQSGLHNKQKARHYFGFGRMNITTIHINTIKETERRVLRSWKRVPKKLEVIFLICFVSFRTAFKLFSCKSCVISNDLLLSTTRWWIVSIQWTSFITQTRLFSNLIGCVENLFHNSFSFSVIPFLFNMSIQTQKLSHFG